MSFNWEQANNCFIYLYLKLRFNMTIILLSSSFMSFILFLIRDFLVTQYPPEVLCTALFMASKLKTLTFPDPYLMHQEPSSTLGLYWKKQATVSLGNSLSIIFLSRADVMQVSKTFLRLESSESRWWMRHLSLPFHFLSVSQLQSVYERFSFDSIHLEW